MQCLAEIQVHKDVLSQSLELLGAGVQPSGQTWPEMA